MATPIESLMIGRGEEKTLASQTLDGGVWLTIRFGDEGMIP